MLQQQHNQATAQRVETDVTIQTAARLLGYKKNALFSELRRLGLIDRNNRAARAYVRQGLIRSETSHWQHKITKQWHQYERPMLTQAGLDWLRELGATQ